MGQGCNDTAKKYFRKQKTQIKPDEIQNLGTFDVIPWFSPCTSVFSVHSVVQDLGF
jgi:hypothetical protein